MSTRTSFAAHIAPEESRGIEWFFGREKLQRQDQIFKISGVENFGELIVTVFQSQRLLIVTCLNEL